MAVLLLALLVGCGAPAAETDDVVIVATTYPVYCLVTAVVGDAPGYEVAQMVSEPVSCLHDYTLTARDMRLVERADVLVLSGAGLEEFLADALDGCKAKVLDSSEGITIRSGDPHHWLDPRNAAQMARNIGAGLGLDAEPVAAELEALLPAALERLSGLPCRELVTFHDGFSYLADCLDLTVLMAIEEEEGAEASAKELTAAAALVREHRLPAVFSEVNGSQAAAQTIAAETGVKVFPLTTMLSPIGAESGGVAGYCALFAHNVAVLEEALT